MGGRWTALRPACGSLWGPKGAAAAAARAPKKNVLVLLASAVDTRKILAIKFYKNSKRTPSALGLPDLTEPQLI